VQNLKDIDDPCMQKMERLSQKNTGTITMPRRGQDGGGTGEEVGGRRWEVERGEARMASSKSS